MESLSGVQVRKFAAHYCCRGACLRVQLRIHWHQIGQMSQSKCMRSESESEVQAINCWLSHIFVFLFYLYRRIDDDRGKSYELGQSAVKCMRGILECWIKQAYRVELFKQRQSNQHALHSKFHLHTGEEIFSDDLYNHLQIDVVSIYLIFLVQMITSGLQIIYTQVNGMPANSMPWWNEIIQILWKTCRMRWLSFRIWCIMWSEHTEHLTSVCGNVDRNITMEHQKFTPRP